VSGRCAVQRDESETKAGRTARPEPGESRPHRGAVGDVATDVDRARRGEGDRVRGLLFAEVDGGEPVAAEGGDGLAPRAEAQHERVLDPAAGPAPRDRQPVVAGDRDVEGERRAGAERRPEAPVAVQEAPVAAPVSEPTLESEAPDDEEPAAAPAPEPEPDKPVRAKESA